MRVLFTSTLGASEWAGSEIMWFQAAARLVTDGHDVAVVLPQSMQAPDTLERMRTAGVEVLRGKVDPALALGVRLARRRRPVDSTPFAPINRHARKWKADVVVLSQASCWGAYSEMLALADDGIPYVSISQLNTPFSWPDDKLFEAVGRAFAGAKAAVFVSQGNLDLLENQIALKLDNAHVIYNLPSFDVSEPCGQPPKEVFRLLNVARIDPGHKGQDILLDVLAMPKWRERNVELEIAGGGNRDWLERLTQVKGLKNVKILGHVDSLKEVWQRTTFGVFPSRYEGMPLAMIEGMALGRAVIATDVAGHGEWIENGVNGFLAEGTTPRSLERTLEKAWVMQGQAASLGHDAWQTYRRMRPQGPDAPLTGLILSELSAVLTPKPLLHI